MVEKSAYDSVAINTYRLTDRTRDLKMDIFGVDTDARVLRLFDSGFRPVVRAYPCARTGGAGSHNAGLQALARNIDTDRIVCPSRRMVPPGRQDTGCPDPGAKATVGEKTPGKWPNGLPEMFLTFRRQRRAIASHMP